MTAEQKHPRGAVPAGAKVEELARRLREFEAEAWPDCKAAGMNQKEFSRYVVAYAGDISTPPSNWSDTKGEVLEAHRQRCERVKQKMPIQDGYLSAWAEKETWHPEEAVYLVCGVKPPRKIAREIASMAIVPEEYDGLCGSIYTEVDGLNKGAEISCVRSKWDERLETPTKIPPLEFIAWCEKRHIDTAWISSIKRTTESPAPSASTPNPTTSETLQDAGQPGAQGSASVTTEAGSVTAVKVSTAGTGGSEKPLCMWDAIGSFFVEKMKTGQFSTAKDLFHAVEAAPDSPFKKGTGRHAHKLWINSIGKPLALKTFQTHYWENTRRAAGLG